MSGTLIRGEGTARAVPPRRHGPRSLGQHFLHDAAYADRAVAAADLTSEDVVLEIGPGEGVLTRRLADAAGDVVAIERDPDLAWDLRELADNVRVVEGDAVTAEWPAFSACVSNLPYQVSSPVLFRLLDTRGWRTAVLMVQKEFADRLVAAPATKAYGRLTVNAALSADVTRVARVPPGAFTPPPRVDSALIRLTPRPAPFRVVDETLFHGVVLAAFTQRRKTLANALRNAAHLVGADPARVRDAAPHVPHRDARADSLPPAAFADVANALSARGLTASQASGREP